jgi:hypothetical protein
MLSVAISLKWDNYPGNNKSETNTNGSLHCTNQGPEDRIPKMIKWNIIQMGAYTVPTWGQRTASQRGAYTVSTKGQRTVSREIAKQGRIQTRIWPPTLNTERHGILIAQIWIKNLNHIKYSKNIILIKRKTLWHGQTRQMTGLVDNRQAKVRSVYTDQGKYNPLVWLYKTTSDWDHPARLSALSHAFCMIN